MEIQIFSQDKLHSLPKILLSSGQTHIWILDIMDADLFCEALPYLSNEERAHAEHLKKEMGKKSYVVSHGILRKLLAHYLSVSSEHLHFQINEHGKPELDSIHFNLSHSGEYAAIIFCLDDAVGIDIEKVRASFSKERIIKRMFHPDEQAYLATLKENEKTTLFFRFWTIREAFLKAIGQGFSIPSASFCIEPDTEKGTDNYYKITKSREDYTSWEIQSIPAPDGYLCSIAYLKSLPERNSV